MLPLSHCLMYRLKIATGVNTPFSLICCVGFLANPLKAYPQNEQLEHLLHVRAKCMVEKEHKGFLGTQKILSFGDPGNLHRRHGNNDILLSERQQALNL